MGGGNKMKLEYFVCKLFPNDGFLTDLLLNKFGVDDEIFNVSFEESNGRRNRPLPEKKY
jgi:hypothetical protein